MKPHLWVIKFIGVLVPRRLRAGWRQEWEAELRYREELLTRWDRLDRRNKLDLLRRSAGAFWFVAVPLFLIGMSFVACWIPARRATQVDPLVAIRRE